MHRPVYSAGASALFFCAFAATASAQSIYVLDMTATTARVNEYTMIDASCLTGPSLLSSFPVLTGGTLPCPAAMPVAAPFGDMAVDNSTDDVWVTDGVVLTSFDASGAALVSLQSLAGYLPGMMTGLGMDSTSSPKRMFATNGTDAIGFFPPGGCVAAGFSVAFPGMIPTPTGALVTDIDYDPVTDSLFACDVDGFVTNFDASSGALISVPFFVTLGLEGIAFDDSTGNLLISDGTVVLNYDTSGALAAPSFHAPAPFVLPPSTMRGMGFAARPVSYGASSGPSLSYSGGQSYSGNASFAAEVTGAAPGATVLLYRSTAPVCPSFPVTALNLPLNILPTVFFVAGALAPTGSAVLPTPLTTIPSGIEVFTQALVISATLDVTNGVCFTTSEL